MFIIYSTLLWFALEVFLWFPKEKFVFGDFFTVLRNLQFAFLQFEQFYKKNSPTLLQSW